MSADGTVTINGERYTFDYDIDGAIWNDPVPECPECHELLSFGRTVTGLIHDANINPVAVVCSGCDHRMEVTR